MDKVTIEH